MSKFNVILNEEEVLKLFEDRLKFWTEEKSFIDLYMKMYRQDFADGLFDNVKIDVKEIVDNDWVNEYSIYLPGFPEYDEYVDDYEKVRVYGNEMILVSNR